MDVILHLLENAAAFERFRWLKQVFNRTISFHDWQSRKNQSYFRNLKYFTTDMSSFFRLSHPLVPVRAIKR